MSHPRRTIPWLVAATLATGVGVAVAQPAAAAVGCRVDYTVTNQWAAGFGADVKITNLGDAVSGWTLTWSFARRADGDAGVERDDDAERRAGDRARTSPTTAPLATGASASFGFNGTWSGSNPVPASFALNGTTCTGGTTTPTPHRRRHATTPTPTATPTATPTPTADATTTPPAGAWQAEKLDRGLISVRSGSGNLVQWRLLGTEPASTGFNVYRGGTQDRRRRSPTRPTTSTPGRPRAPRYTVRAVVNGAEQAASAPSLTFGNGYLDVPIQRPSGDHVANDGSVGDLDGDGQLEVVLKWDPTNAKDNSQSGVHRQRVRRRVRARTARGCGGSTWAATSGPARTTRSSRSTTTTATARPRSR